MKTGLSSWTSYVYRPLKKGKNEKRKVYEKFNNAQLAQRRCDSVVTTSLLTLSQRCGTVENASCTDVSFRRCDNVALQRCQDVATTSPQH